MFFPYKLADGSTVMVEASEEVVSFILNNDRELANAERRERYHTPYSLDAMVYESPAIAYRQTPEKIVIKREFEKEFKDALAELTLVQQRRVLMKADGMTLREIALLEDTTVNAVVGSLKATKKKLRKFKNCF